MKYTTINKMFKTLTLITFIDIAIIIVFLIMLISILKYNIFELNIILGVILTIMFGIRIGLMGTLISFYIGE